MTCVFCEGIKNSQVLLETEYFKIVFDIDPIQCGHLLILSKAHIENLLEIPNEQLLELMSIQKRIIHLLEEQFHVDGVSIIQNNGAIMDEGTHFHVHVIPRYHNDSFWDNQEVIEQPIAKDEFMKQLKQLNF